MLWQLIEARQPDHIAQLEALAGTTQRAAVDCAIEQSGFRNFLPASPAVAEGPPLALPPPGDFPGMLCSIW
jgi:hypothetical protein